jgi:hypothetical protein
MNKLANVPLDVHRRAAQLNTVFTPEPEISGF